MRRMIRWGLLYAALSVAIALLGAHIHTEASSTPPWDGVYRCAPGEAYTTAECK